MSENERQLSRCPHMIRLKMNNHQVGRAPACKSQREIMTTIKIKSIDYATISLDIKTARNSNAHNEVKINHG
jgi:hypothetical protein